MHSLRRTLLLPAIALASALCGCRHAPQPLGIPARENPAQWAKDIEVFREQDRTHPAPKGCVVFVGSSSIRFWSTLADDMAPIPVLNRGFGGSKLFDSVYYAHDLVSVHEPSLVVVFSGTNDLAGADAKSAVEVHDLFRQLVARLRAEDRELEVAYIAITPTLAREVNRATVREANRLIQIECEADARLDFIDPTPALMDAGGKPDPQWFRDDRLHLNPRGYEVWTRCIRPTVERLYAQQRSRASN
ncbi:MAG: hypothetical protein IPJ19_20285 [Planctomycetes bacterium]|nr:hypothetical protein [Planctomycetota bacterium]